MPLYEYACRDCGGSFEYLQKIDARPKRKCETCGGKLEKLVSRSGFVLKGSGWYVTDFRDGDKKKPKDDAREGAEGESGGKSDDAKEGAKKAKEKPAADGAGKTGSGKKKAAGAD